MMNAELSVCKKGTYSLKIGKVQILHVADNKATLSKLERVQTGARETKDNCHHEPHLRRAPRQG